MDEMIDTHLYPHGPYAMGALDLVGRDRLLHQRVNQKPLSRWLILDV